MKRIAIILMLLVLLSGCGVTERPESSAPEPTVSSFEPVISPLESSAPEKEKEPEPTQAISENQSKSPAEEPPAETGKPAEAEPVASSAGNDAPQDKPEAVETPPSEPAESIAPEPTQEPQKPPQSEPEPEFNAEVWVSLARCYGGEIGLSYGSAATGCWGTPIEANASCVYRERDIRNTLDWYKASGFTAFCVWSESLGSGNYNIYIGYA